MLDGIAQDGTALGRPDAPVTLVEYADLQCPYCAQWALGALPALVEDYVRAGKLRIEFHGLAFIGPDSEVALRTALAAGRQDRLWHVVELLYASQGAENSGWVTEDLVARTAASVPRLEPRQLAADRQSEAVDAEIAKAQAQAQASNVRGTPAFEIGRTGSTLRRLEVTSLEPAQFRKAVEAVLAG
jgi:protein-disulfide isomerase